MYFSWFFFILLDFFAWQMVILQEWKKFTTIQEWPSSALRKTSDLEYQRVCRDIYSTANIWNISDDESNEEESISNDWTLYSENICFVISSLWNEREKHINTDYAINCWMLFVITHIREDVFNNAQNKHHIQVNNVIKALFSGSTEK